MQIVRFVGWHICIDHLLDTSNLAYDCPRALNTQHRLSVVGSRELDLRV